MHHARLRSNTSRGETAESGSKRAGKTDFPARGYVHRLKVFDARFAILALIEYIERRVSLRLVIRIYWCYFVVWEFSGE